MLGALKQTTTTEWTKSFDPQKGCSLDEMNVYAVLVLLMSLTHCPVRVSHPSVIILVFLSPTIRGLRVFLMPEDRTSFLCAL